MSAQRLFAEISEVAAADNEQGFGLPSGIETASGF